MGRLPGKSLTRRTEAENGCMPHYHFVTGKLAEPSLRRVLSQLGPQKGFEWSIGVLPITVAALATVPWIQTHHQPPSNVDRIYLPGLCSGDLDLLRKAWEIVSVERGPKDLRDLPEFFGSAQTPLSLEEYDVEILAEINHAPRLSQADVLRIAKEAVANGANCIDLGCEPGARWRDVGATVSALCGEGMRVSLDTFDRWEAETGAKAGVELILSVNASNREACIDWGCEVVAVPDAPDRLDTLEATVDFLECHHVSHRLDPILEPIGFGFANSLGRYLETRKRFPDKEMLMGVGNLTELTDADSAGLNVMLLGFCQEMGIRSVLTTEVINWARSSVRELDLARRLVYHACKNRTLPKKLMPDLVLLRDPKLREFGEDALRELASQVTDRNVRIFAERGKLVVLSRDVFLEGTDPFDLFDALCERLTIDVSHAFYLGYEFAKAITALTLHKNYVQDQALRWGYLTLPEISHRSKPMNEQKTANGE